MNASYRVLAAGSAGAALLSGFAWGLRQHGASIGPQESHCIDHNLKFLSKAPLDPPVPGARLKLVQVVFRHGARTPLTQRYWEGTKWDVCGSAYHRPHMVVRDIATGEVQEACRDGTNLVHYEGGCTKGELTLLGQTQALEFGQWLHGRYIDALGYLPQEWVPGALEARSTNIRRTRDTLHGVLTGLYPNTQEAMDVGTASKADEILVANVDRCSRLAVLYKQARKSAVDSGKADKAIVALDQRIRGLLGLSTTDEKFRISWTELHDAMTSMQAHGKTVPDALTDIDLAHINKQATDRMLSLVGDAAFRDILKLSMGRLLHTLTEQFDASAARPAVAPAAAAEAAAAPRPQMLLYSGHDTTLMPLLLALGQNLTDWPPYMSHLVFELWTKPADKASKGTDFVRVMYNQAEIKLPGYPGLLTLDQFKNEILGGLTLSEDAHMSLCAIPDDELENSGSVDTTSY